MIQAKCNNDFHDRFYKLNQKLTYYMDNPEDVDVDSLQTDYWKLYREWTKWDHELSESQAIKWTLWYGYNIKSQIRGKRMSYDKDRDGDTVYLDRNISQEDYIRYAAILRKDFDITLERTGKFHRIIKYTGKEDK